MKADIGKCPRCKAGNLEMRKGRYGDFFGCSQFPKCTFMSASRPHKKTQHIEFRDPQVFPGHYEGGK